ncbi:hypothetical protein OIU84_013895 [Salix udensis]|uniref:BHLH domain-containing protein n=1 Tax=Salix udensis TaxID=889485 RepID=A0AAD6JAZ8_9ROSI|nr:hypothetical protein OIU84_013895 [Salix udensis]
MQHHSLHHGLLDTSPWQQSNPSSNSSCEEDLSMSTSFTNASNHSGLTVESARQLVEPSSSTELIGEHASDSQLWSHILLGVGSNDEMENSQDVGENLLDALSSKTTSTMSSGIFGPASDYSKKLMDSNWELTNPKPFNSFEKQLNGCSESSIGSGRLNKLVSHLSIAPPNPEAQRQLFDPLPCNTYSFQHQTYSNSTPCLVGESRNSGFQSCYSRDPKVENEHREISTAPFRRSFNSNGGGYHIGLNSSVCPKPRFKPINLSDSRKQGIQTSSPNGKGHGTTNEEKKKRFEETSETAVKKAKHESSSVSSVKMQAPKVKLSERVTALQQIVSPFGRTDTASVLYEAIQYIKFLQGQVQLLSNPYMKTTNSQKDPLVGLDRKDKGDAELDLKSRGLCLVPISCTPQIYHDNTGSDYWTPAYRGMSTTSGLTTPSSPLAFPKTRLMTYINRFFSFFFSSFFIIICFSQNDIEIPLAASATATIASESPEHFSLADEEEETTRPSAGNCVLRFVVDEMRRGSVRLQYTEDVIDAACALQKDIGGAILADERGLGKTIQGITHLTLLKCLHNDPGLHLIACPASVGELGKWCPSFSVLQHHGATRPTTSAYSKELGSLAEAGFPPPFNVLFEKHSSQQKDDYKILKHLQWSCVAMDEAHALKDKNSYRWRNLVSAARNANQRLMLTVTGTPLQNDFIYE